MATLEKIKKKKGKQIAPAAGQPPAQPTPQGSLISVQEAGEEDKTDTVQAFTPEDIEDVPQTGSLQPEDGTTGRSSSPRPGSRPVSPGQGSPRPGSAASATRGHFRKNVVEPVDNQGSMVSIKSKEAWNEDGEKPKESRRGSAMSSALRRPLSAHSKHSAVTPLEKDEAGPASPLRRPPSAMSNISNKPQIPVVTPFSQNAATRGPESATRRPPSAVSRHSVVSNTSALSLKPQDTTSGSSKTVLGPAEMNESHAYVPYTYAKDCISRIVEDMKRMKSNHIRIVDDIQLTYGVIEDETQAQFNIFVVSLRDQYSQKVTTFRQVIEVHRIELQQKQQYWDEALASMGGRNRKLLLDKKMLLIQNKVEFDRLEKEKKEAVERLTKQLDESNASLTQEKSEHEVSIAALQVKEQETKVLNDQLETEKSEKAKIDEENERLREEIEELRRRPVGVAAVAVAEDVETQNAAPVDYEPTVVVTDLSEEERRRMTEERERMAEERESMREDRKRMEEERLNFVAERRKFHEEKVMLQGEVTNITKEREIWKVKFESLKSQLGELAELRAKYEALQAQMSAIAFLAVAHTEEDKIRIKEKISKAEQDKEIMTEEKLQMERDIKKFMDEFQKENGREPNEDEKPDSLRELEVSLAEADSMIRNLDVQIETLEKLKSGVVPEAPVVAVVPIDYKEPEVKTVEVTVPDPVVVSQLDKTQTELEELKKELSDSKKDNTSLREQISHLEAEVADVRAEVTAQEATIEALKEQLEEARRSLALGVGVAAGQSDADVEKLLREKEKEFEKELKEKEKERKQLEKDLKKLLKAQAKQQKTDDNERVKKLLEATVREVVGIHSEVGRASELVNERLKAVEGEKDGGIEKQQAAQQEYDNWVIGWAEENGKEPTPKERDGDAEGKKLFAVVEASGKASEDTELSIEALNMIKTGHVPDKLQPAPVVAAASVALTASAAGSGKDTSELEDKIAELEDEISELKSDNKDLENNNNDLEEKIEELERQLEEAKASIGLGVSAAVTADTSGDDLEELNAQLSVLQKQVDAAEGALAEEKSAHDMTQEELEALQRQLQEMNTELQNTQAEAQAKLEGATTQKQQEIDALNKKIDEMQARVDELEKARLDNVPVDTAKEILALKASITAGEVARDSLQKEKFASDAKVKELDVKIKSLENSTKSQKTASNDSEKKMKALKAEKDKEIKSIQNQNEKKEKERQKQEEKKIAALEKKIQQLQIAAAAGAGAGAGAASAKGGKADAKGGAGDAKLQEKLRETKAEATELKAKVKQLELELKTVAKSAGSSDKEVEKQNKKNEKILKELEKKLDSVTKKNEKNESNLKKKEEELKDTQKELKDTEDEVTKLKAELAALGIAAKEGVEAANKVKSLESEVKKLTDENKTLSENFQSERVLRKKYYNMVEDMKGKIRVYCRVRPMSGSEKDRGNYSVAKSPDEYTITLDSTRGVKEFQFDQVFMPESSQERVFEDTNNLIQSAVDGYNVCIFAYGQTGSGKTFTIIGDSSQKFPGIAPRAFDRIFTLLDENKSKFGYTVSCYMLELYNDKLLDLFSKTGAEQERHSDKLDIKKDKKGMVVVQGAEVKKAKTAKDLMALFEEGSVNRHTASTKMNAESSRSHLVIGIIIETTNKVSGQIMKGKLSLVDLAGSERAAKTGAGAEQLKEAMSINKSLSALGDVISALSSEQSFIPYRNNKLTMLMQDSLGGNAKTLMFVNISPADYNTDESVVSLTYASRVKLITNDASKNADNKEIARLKGIISKLKKGDAVEEEDEEVVE